MTEPCRLPRRPSLQVLSLLPFHHAAEAKTRRRDASTPPAGAVVSTKSVQGLLLKLVVWLGYVKYRIRASGSRAASSRSKKDRRAFIVLAS